MLFSRAYKFNITIHIFDPNYEKIEIKEANDNADMLEFLSLDSKLLYLLNTNKCDD